MTLNTRDSFELGWNHGNREQEELSAREIEEIYPNVDVQAFVQGNLDGIEGDRWRLEFEERARADRTTERREWK